MTRNTCPAKNIIFCSLESILPLLPQHSLPVPVLPPLLQPRCHECLWEERLLKSQRTKYSMSGSSANGAQSYGALRASRRRCECSKISQQNVSNIKCFNKYHQISTCITRIKHTKAINVHCNAYTTSIIIIVSIIGPRVIGPHLRFPEYHPIRLLAAEVRGSKPAPFARGYLCLRAVQEPASTWDSQQKRAIGLRVYVGHLWR